MASMPSLLYGTAWKDIRTADLVLLAFVHGFRAVDTAGQPKHYKEDLVGKGLDAACAQLELQRHDIWIQTKQVNANKIHSDSWSGSQWTAPV